MTSRARAGILALSVSERIQLVEDIWDSIAQIPGSVPVTASQKAELDRRLTAYRKNPSAGSSWEVVKKRLRKSL